MTKAQMKYHKVQKLVAEGKSITDAAKACKLNISTYYNIRKKEQANPTPSLIVHEAAQPTKRKYNKKPKAQAQDSMIAVVLLRPNMLQSFIAGLQS